MFRSADVALLVISSETTVMIEWSTRHTRTAKSATMGDFPPRAQRFVAVTVLQDALKGMAVALVAFLASG